MRPSRFYVTKDDMVVMASEVGVLEFPPENIAIKERLHPGRIFLVDTEERLTGVVPIARLFLHEGSMKLRELKTDSLFHVTVDETQDRVTELVDKYNLLALPVTQHGKLAGVITADDVITVLRQG